MFFEGFQAFINLALTRLIPRPGLGRKGEGEADIIPKRAV
jgi:hypothetical protein